MTKRKLLIAFAAAMPLILLTSTVSAANKLRDRKQSSSMIHPDSTLKDRSSSTGKTTYECSLYSDTCLIVIYAAPPASASASIDGNEHSKACYVAFEFDITHAPKNTKKFVWVLVDAREDGYTYRFDNDTTKAVELAQPDQYKYANHEDTDKRIFHWHIKQVNASSSYNVKIWQKDKDGNETLCDGTDPVIANS